MQLGHASSPDLAWETAALRIRQGHFQEDIKGVAKDEGDVVAVHAWDALLGKPIAGLPVQFFSGPDYRNSFEFIDAKTTDEHGWINNILPAKTFLNPAFYQITFHLSPYLKTKRRPWDGNVLSVDFRVKRKRESRYVSLCVEKGKYTLQIEP